MVEWETKYDKKYFKANKPILLVPSAHNSKHGDKLMFCYFEKHQSWALAVIFKIFMLFLHFLLRKFDLWLDISICLAMK